MPPFPTLEETDRIAALSDPVLRNLRITHCYHELAVALAERTGPFANWCTFATWASKQAGQTIRHEDLARMLEHRVMAAPPTLQAAADVTAAAQQAGARPDLGNAQPWVSRALNPLAAVEHASAAVARGNQKVFAEIGREFARFAAACGHDQTFAADNLARFCAALRPGDPPEGQRYLRQAFTRYYQAFFEADPKTRAELILLANLEIGLHEQTRLQPEIAEALEAPAVDSGRWLRALLEGLAPWRSWPVYAFTLLMRFIRRPTPLDLASRQLTAVLRQQARLLLTEHLMTLGFPRGVALRLGTDLQAEFPEALQQITHPELRALLAHIDPTPNSLHGTGAVDWAQLPERLHFIADLFRCYAVTPQLAEPPFTPEQVAHIKAGRRPPGAL